MLLVTEDCEQWTFFAAWRTVPRLGDGEEVAALPRLHAARHRLPA
jgi:hypothetical protein